MVLKAVYENLIRLSTLVEKKSIHPIKLITAHLMNNKSLAKVKKCKFSKSSKKNIEFC